MKHLKTFALLLFATILLSSCKFNGVQQQQSNEQPSRFIVIEKTEIWCVAYDTETKVMYTISRGTSNCGTFAMLYNSDGKPLLYHGN